MSTSSYQPFLIGEGKYQSGLFQYYESWVKPQDAFDELLDGYVNRGQLWKRNGYTRIGVMRYCSSQVLTHGDGTTGPYTGAFNTNTPKGAHLPIIAGSVTVRARETTPATETFTDNGTGTLTGSLGGSGTINYTTGAWSITTAANVAAASPITIEYAYEPTTATNQHVNVYAIAQGNGAITQSGTLTRNLPISPNSFFIVAKQSNGVETYTDNGLGTLTGSLAGTGTINYTTGAWSIDPTGANTITANTVVQAGYSMVGATFTIMGLSQWNDESNNTFKLVACDTRRAAVYNLANNVFDPICDVEETLFISDGSTLTYNNASASYLGTFPLIMPLSVTIQTVNTATGVAINTTVDDGAGAIVASGNIASGTINYYTGAISITFTAPEPATTAVNATFSLQNDYFFGDNSNFFNWTNWELPTNNIVTKAAVANYSPTQFQTGFLYLTNNVDPVTLYNGSKLSRPAYAIEQNVLGLGKNQILRCLDVKVFASRLLFVRPTTTVTDGQPDPQSIRWSAQFQATNFVSDIPGSGGESSAATSDWIQHAKFLKDFIVVHFENSVWMFRNTGNAFNPFVWFKLNSTKNTKAPYGGIEFDDVIKAMGLRGLTFCDGNAVERYDLKVIDLFEDINAERFGQCFGIRFDALNQAWMLFPYMEDDSQVSNRALLHNYIEDSWGVFRLNLSCLGFGFGIKDLTWADLTISWEDADFAWNSYLVQSETLRLIGGDFNGNIVQLNDGNTDLGTAIQLDVTTKKFNPFVKEGMRANFGYLDIYYTVTTDTDPAAFITIDFFIDNNTAVAFTRTMNLVGTTQVPANDEYAWQRIFINVNAQFLRWRIRDNGVAQFNILGQIFWAAPGGRLIL